MQTSGHHFRVRGLLRRLSEGTKTRLESEPSSGLGRPGVGSKWSLSVDAPAQCLELRVGRGCVDPVDPFSRAGHGAGMAPEPGFGGKAGGQARPGPMFRAHDEVRSQRVALDLAQDDQEVLILLDGEGFEAPLPDVTIRMVVRMIPPDVRRQEPLHPSAQIAVGARPKREVQMVRHQAESHHPHRQSDASFRDQRHEGGVVSLLVIDLSPAVSSIDGVIAEPTLGSPS
jgi:hypothetical protein